MRPLHLRLLSQQFCTLRGLQRRSIVSPLSISCGTIGPFFYQTAWQSSQAAPSNDSPATSSSNKHKDDDWGEWIPPNRPLVGDRGESHLYTEEAELKDIERQIQEMETVETRPSAPKQSAGTPDWLQTRRTKLGPQAIDMLAPGESRDLIDIPVRHHTLLKKDEIATCLEALGGRDITVILDNPDKPRMGGALGMILVTAASHSQLRLLAQELVRQLKLRHLHEVGVVGARDGPEGNFRDKYATETWIVVDCWNYVVHMLDADTRMRVNLEDLWSGKDPLFELDWQDEDAVERYVADHPAPEEFGTSSAVELDTVLKRLQKTRYTVPRKGAGAQKKEPKKLRRRR